MIYIYIYISFPCCYVDVIVQGSLLSQAFSVLEMKLDMRYGETEDIGNLMEMDSAILEKEASCIKCLFCRIVRSEVESRKVYEDAEVIAFVDINPMAPLHILIVPKRHIAMLSDATAEDMILLGKMMLLAPTIVKEQGFCPGADGGFRLMLNNGPDGGQEIPHIHLHVMAGPRPWGRGKHYSLASPNVIDDSRVCAEVAKGSVFVPVRKGRLAAAGAPGKGGVLRWANAGATAVVTLLSEEEVGVGVQEECQRLGLSWLHLPLKGRCSITNPLESDMISLLRIQPELCHLLEGRSNGSGDGGSSVVVHCAAGLH